MADTNLNAAQLQHIQKQMQGRLELAIEQMGLRKYALEQALPHGTTPAQIIDIAQALFDFMVAPANIKFDLGG